MTLSAVKQRRPNRAGGHAVAKAAPSLRMLPPHPRSPKEDRTPWR